MDRLKYAFRLVLAALPPPTAACPDDFDYLITDAHDGIQNRPRLLKNHGGLRAADFLQLRFAKRQHVIPTEMDGTVHHARSRRKQTE
jgi:hypothetical protein